MDSDISSSTAISSCHCKMPKPPSSSCTCLGDGKALLLPLKPTSLLKDYSLDMHSKTFKVRSSQQKSIIPTTSSHFIMKFYGILQLIGCLATQAATTIYIGPMFILPFLGHPLFARPSSQRPCLASRIPTISSTQPSILNILLFCNATESNNQLKRRFITTMDSLEGLSLWIRPYDTARNVLTTFQVLVLRVWPEDTRLKGSQ